MKAPRTNEWQRVQQEHNLGAIVIHCDNLLAVHRDPKLLKGHRRRTMRTDGWQPKRPRNSIWQAGEPSLLRDFRSPTVVARVLVTSRVNHRSGYRVGEGFHRTGVTIEPRPVGEQTNKKSTGSSINLEQEHH